jgi:hypothetical protein
MVPHAAPHTALRAGAGARLPAQPLRAAAAGALRAPPPRRALQSPRKAAACVGAAGAPARELAPPPPPPPPPPPLRAARSPARRARGDGECRPDVAGDAAAAVALAWLALAAPAHAYTAAVDVDGVTSVAQNAVGVLFTITFAAFLLRVLRKRASRATNVRVAVERKAQAAAAPAPPLEPVTAGNCFLGAALALVCAVALWTFTGFVESLFDAQPASDQYAVRNVTGTLRSILTGLCYLATFLFGANAVGLSGLGVQTLMNAGAAAPGAPPRYGGDAPPPLE